MVKPILRLIHGTLDPNFNCNFLLNIYCNAFQSIMVSQFGNIRLFIHMNSLYKSHISGRKPKTCISCTLNQKKTTLLATLSTG